MGIENLRPDASSLAIAFVLDLIVGDPNYQAHPVRLMGRSLTFFETLLRGAGLSGYSGGILLFLLLALLWLSVTALLVLFVSGVVAAVLHVLLLYSLIAMGDLVKHVRAVDGAAREGDLEETRTAISRLVGRDTSMMDAAACRRAAIESLSENIVDGFVSPVFWYALGGLPGIVLFKVVSTMDSMVGYKTPRYLKFGWCGARTDDLMNFVPARLAYLLLAAGALFVPKCSVLKALRIGWQQHAIVPGPNSGWSEATTAGAIQRKLIGPIWANGNLVTEVWLGDPSDPPAGESADFQRALALNVIAGFASVGIAMLALSRAN